MSAFWMLATLASLNAAVLFFMYLRLRRKVSDALELDEVLAKARREVGSLVAELNLAADRSVSLLEDRISQASSAVEKVEKAVLAVDRKAAGSERERGMYERLSRARPLLRDAASPERGLPVQPPSEPGERTREAAAGNGVAEMPEVRAVEEPILTGKSPAERAVELWRSGFSAQIISLRTGMTLSEINLAIAMEEQRLLWNASAQS